MRSRTSNWFEVGIRYQKTQEDGSEKSVTEKYAIDALSFTEGESAITEEMAAYISGEFKVKSMQEASYREVFFSDKKMMMIAGTRQNCNSFPMMIRPTKRSVAT